MIKLSSKTSIKELAGIVSAQLKKHGFDSVLVGGAVVSIYSKNEYQSKDLDFISPADHGGLVTAMSEIGFLKKGKDFHHKELDYTVEFPTGPVAIGDEVPVLPEGKLKTKSGVVKILSPSQCVMDRLAWYYHYNDRQCLDQALMVARNHNINLNKIKAWSKNEGAAEKYEQFLNKLKIN